MSYTLRVSISQRMAVVEQADATISPLSGSGGNQRSFADDDVDGLALTASTTPPVGGETVDLSWELSGTTKDFDLTAAPTARDSSETVDKSTKKLVGIQIHMAPDNDPAGVTFGPQGGNGYALFGASKTITLYPGAKLQLVYGDAEEDVTLATPTVGGSAKDLRFAGAAGDSWTGKLVFNG